MLHGAGTGVPGPGWLLWRPRLLPRHKSFKRRFAKTSQSRRVLCLNSDFNVKVLLGAFNQEKALAGAFSVIVKSSRTFV